MQAGLWARDFSRSAAARAEPLRAWRLAAFWARFCIALGLESPGCLTRCLCHLSPNRKSCGWRFQTHGAFWASARPIKMARSWFAKWAMDLRAPAFFGLARAQSRAKWLFFSLRLDFLIFHPTKPGLTIWLNAGLLFLCPNCSRRSPASA